MASRTKAQQRAYDALLAKLPPLPSDDPPDRKKRVDAARQAILIEEGDKPSAPALVHRYTALSDAKDAAEQVVKDINVELDAVTELLADQFDAEGVTSLRTKDAHISVYVEPYTSVNDHDALRGWCVKQGLERAMRLPWQSVNSITKQRLEDGLPEPDGVTLFAKTKIRLERVK